MKKIKHTHKIILLLLAIAAGIIFSELLFGLIGHINRGLSLPKYDFAQMNDDEYLIYCLGDSYTYGHGAGFNDSYPMQLEQILKNTVAGRPLRVLNLGVPGYNSSQILKRLRSSIKKRKPDLVIIACGENDRWNLDDVMFKSRLYTLKSFWLRSKTHKFLSVFLEKIKTQDQEFFSCAAEKTKQLLSQENDPGRLVKLGNIYRDFDFFGHAKLFYKKAEEISGENKAIKIELGRCYKLNREFPQAIAIFSDLIDNFPKDKTVQEEIKDVFVSADAPLQQIRFFEDLLERTPDHRFAKHQLALAYTKKGGDCFLSGQLKQAKIYYQKAKKLFADFDYREEDAPHIAESLVMVSQEIRLRKKLTDLKYKFKKPKLYIIADDVLTREIAERILYDNAREMIEICRAQNIGLIFSGYPRAESEDYTNPVNKLCFQNDIPIAEHSDSFIKALQEKPFEYYYVSRVDPHCTKNGYRIMAENIALKILENKYIK